ncbi:hypothetical protein [Pseudoxanthomonas kaohsiungensis]|uniref:Uncharacterized protein n=1 Tax=Pseudoxanthomonas kaohsiungensis TaxID=283923 RepID=A0ABW3LXN1_9GAMM|nr:hypothetical protein [Pseudoxanthomonas kaohsiungensis]
MTLKWSVIGAGLVALAAMQLVQAASASTLKCVNPAAKGAPYELKAFAIHAEPSRQVVITDGRGRDYEGVLSVRAPLPYNRWRYNIRVSIPDDHVLLGAFGDLVELSAVTYGGGPTYQVFGGIYRYAAGDRHLHGIIPVSQWLCSAQ